jgi:hypothetical protein
LPSLEREQENLYFLTLFKDLEEEEMVGYSVLRKYCLASNVLVNIYIIFCDLAKLNVYTYVCVCVCVCVYIYIYVLI